MIRISLKRCCRNHNCYNRGFITNIANSRSRKLLFNNFCFRAHESASNNVADIADCDVATFSNCAYIVREFCIRRQSFHFLNDRISLLELFFYHFITRVTDVWIKTVFCNILLSTIGFATFYKPKFFNRNQSCSNNDLQIKILLAITRRFKFRNVTVDTIECIYNRGGISNNLFWGRMSQEIRNTCRPDLLKIFAVLYNKGGIAFAIDSAMFASRWVAVTIMFRNSFTRDRFHDCILPICFNFANKRPAVQFWRIPLECHFSEGASRSISLFYHFSGNNLNRRQRNIELLCFLDQFCKSCLHSAKSFGGDKFRVHVRIITRFLHVTDNTSHFQPTFQLPSYSNVFPRSRSHVLVELNSIRKQWQKVHGRFRYLKRPNDESQKALQ